MAKTIKKSNSKPKTRRRKGTGTIFQRGDVWYGRLRVGDQDKLTEPCDTADKAEAQLDAMIGGAIDPRFLPTLADYWEMLLRPDGVFEGRYENDTCNLYDTVRVKWIADSPLGKMRIDQIEKRHVQRHVDKMGKKLKPPTVRRYGGCIHVVLAEAVEDKLLRARIENGVFVPANPADEINYPELGETVAHVHSHAEQVRIPELLFEYNPRLAAMWTNIADTGARPGEMCAMDAEDIVNGVWKIHQMRRHDGTIKKQTKAKNIRYITLSDDCRAAIAAYGQKSGPVWLNEDGNPVRPDALYTHLSRFRKALQKRLNVEAKALGIKPAVVPPLRPKDLRITFATQALKLSDPKDVQKAMGHKKLSTTTDIYARHEKGSSSELIEALTRDRQRGLFGDRGANKTARTPSDSRNSLYTSQAV